MVSSAPTSLLLDTAATAPTPGVATATLSDLHLATSLAVTQATDHNQKNNQNSGSQLEITNSLSSVSYSLESPSTSSLVTASASEEASSKSNSGAIDHRPSKMVYVVATMFLASCVVAL